MSEAHTGRIEFLDSGRMSAEVRLWRVSDDDQLIAVGRTPLHLELRLEQWLERDISILDPALLVIGRQVQATGGPIDLLCIDEEGDLVIVELKRDRTPREVTAQALDYASWVVGLSTDEVIEMANRNLGAGLEEEFRKEFGAELPEILNADHRILVVGSGIDSSTERIMRYLSDTHGVNINAATFSYFQPDDGPELLARVFVIEPSEVEHKSRTKRRPNLSYEELKDLAVQNGVGDLYEYAVSALEASLQKQRTRSSVGFAGSFDGSRKVVISLLPGGSEAGALRYQLYQQRFAKAANLDPAEVEKLLPPGRTSWEYSAHGDPDWQGFQGSLTTRDEVDRLAAALSQVSHSDSTGT
jgi:hypothetical protein